MGMSQVCTPFGHPSQIPAADVILKFDMTAWVKRGTREEVGIITDYTDPA
jgi:hypothetical protein